MFADSFELPWLGEKLSLGSVKARPKRNHHHHHKFVPLSHSIIKRGRLTDFGLALSVLFLNRLAAALLFLIGVVHAYAMVTATDLPWTVSNGVLSWFFIVIGTLEAVFAFWTLYKIEKYQAPSKPPKMNAVERLHLVRRCLEAVQSEPGQMQSFFVRWFHGANFSELRRGNIEQWFAWAFFEERWNNLTKSERDEVETFMQIVESSIGPFPPGYNESVRSMRLTLDPVVIAHRPFFYYIVIAIINISHRVSILALGFRPHRTGVLTYWYHPGDADVENQVPIVLIHGLGVGLFQYFKVIHHLMELKQPLLLVEIPNMASQLSEQAFDMHEVLSSIKSMLSNHGYSRAIFFGHSYGTVYVSWLIKHEPQLVASAFVADAIVFLLFENDVCGNFIYRVPSSPVELVLTYYAARELHIALSLSRHFHWAQNILWAEDVRVRMTVVLSESDAIVNSNGVRDYLARKNNPNIDVVWLPKHHHAQFLFNDNSLRIVMDSLSKHVKTLQ